MYLTENQRFVMLVQSFDLFEHARDRWADDGYDDVFANAAHGRAQYLQWLAYFLDSRCPTGPRCHPKRCGNPEFEAATGHSCYSTWYDAEFGDPYDSLQYDADGEPIYPHTI